MSKTAIIIASGPSLNVEDWPRLRHLGDTISINYAYIPMQERWEEQYTPTFAFAADHPLRCLPYEWVFGDQQCILNRGNAKYWLRCERDNWLLFDVQKNDDDYDRNPFDEGKIIGPYKSVTLCIQWAFFSGYQRVLLYGVDLHEGGTYAGMDNLNMHPNMIRSRERSHRDILECLKRYPAMLAGRMEIINLNPHSAAKDYIETIPLTDYERTTHGKR